MQKVSEDIFLLIIAVTLQASLGRLPNYGAIRNLFDHLIGALYGLTHAVEIGFGDQPETCQNVPLVLDDVLRFCGGRRHFWSDSLCSCDEGCF